MTTSLSMEDRYFVLEQKLKEAESALFGCRAMLNYCRRLEAEANSPDSFEGTNPKRTGLYPGQLDNYVDPQDLDESNEECLE